ncbi:unnamed protein product [Lymnaea stagnalis]|uniref:Cytochrome oxidase complex assembly protein 1 n=1 Tax=Lymnaea stagnalis TaxID=6523 RepID=A0AAV2IQN2_LYMST
MSSSSLNKLIKVALVGGVVVLGATTWMESKLQSNFRKQGYYTKAVKLLHNYEPASQFLGHPLYSGKVHLADESKLKVEGTTAKLEIPLKGSKGKGALHVLASREKLGDEWTVDQLDLEVFSSKQRWKFYDRQLATPTTLSIHQETPSIST